MVGELAGLGMIILTAAVLAVADIIKGRKGDEDDRWYDRHYGRYWHNTGYTGTDYLLL